MLEWNLLNVRSDKNEPVESSGLNCVDITEKIFLVWLSLSTMLIFFLLLVPKTIARTLAKYTQASFYNPLSSKG